ncbi:MAG: hypothetical protein WHV63_01650 [Ignavibacteria bacterium]|jgi:hypothetical protein|nr:hypothetical protein [Ignavibacteria bacterium]MDH7526994.1 hypothetical protein [Ignavibacteria bacterium]NPV10861.1 hypothetical protein [Ignavibacteria bacterium]
MNTGQTLLVTVGLLLFTIFVLTVYRTTSSRFAFAIANEAIISGTAIAQSMIDEISQKSFDEKTVSGVVSVPDSLTPVSALGPDVGENDPTKFDDIDDYNNFQKTDSLSRLGNFKTRVSVYYVSSGNPDLKSLSRTFYKRVDVFVTNNFISDTIKLYRIISY